jgi:hypothetical protein
MIGNKFIKIIYYALGISFTATIVAYLIKFTDHQVSSKSSDWGVFGDYFGGILNPITASLNIIVFIYLTKVIAETEQKTHQRNLEYQKNLTLSELKHSSYSELTSQLDSLSNRILNSKDGMRFQTILLMTYIHGFFQNMSHLFPLFNDTDNTRPLIESLNSIVSTLELIEKGDGKNNELTSQLKDNVKIYYSEKLILIKKLQLEMLK